MVHNILWIFFSAFLVPKRFSISIQKSKIRASLTVDWMNSLWISECEAISTVTINYWGLSFIQELLGTSFKKGNKQKLGADGQAKEVQFVNIHKFLIKAPLVIFSNFSSVNTVCSELTAYSVYSESIGNLGLTNNFFWKFNNWLISKVDISPSKPFWLLFINIRINWNRV